MTPCPAVLPVTGVRALFGVLSVVMLQIEIWRCYECFVHISRKSAIALKSMVFAKEWLPVMVKRF